MNKLKKTSLKRYVLFSGMLKGVCPILWSACKSLSDLFVPPVTKLHVDLGDYIFVGTLVAICSR